MSEKIFSVRVVKALMEDCLDDGVTSLSESELLAILEISPTKRAVDPPSAPSQRSTGTWSRPMPEIVSTQSAGN